MSAIILAIGNLVIQGIATLYHYTSDEGAVGIGTTKKKIMSSKSEAGDALHGDGVYITDMKPADHKMSQVAYNNYQTPFAKKNLLTVLL